jgi:RNA polymerase sigma factor (TIGR02999 family)
MAAPEMTELLQRLSRGDKQAEEDLIPRVYRELRRIAAAHLRSERPDHTLQATALVHEAYIRLTSQEQLDWKSRTHFFAVAAQVMRRILVDHARKRNAGKRGNGAVVLQLDENLTLADDQCDLVTGIDSALERLARLNPRQAKVVELRFFSGLSEEEIGQVLGVSSRTVKRDWTVARAWLYGELGR